MTDFVEENEERYSDGLDVGLAGDPEKVRFSFSIRIFDSNF